MIMIMTVIMMTMMTMMMMKEKSKDHISNEFFRIDKNVDKMVE